MTMTSFPVRFLRAAAKAHPALRSQLDFVPDFGIDFVSDSGIDIDSDSELVDIDASLFTAHNEGLKVVDEEMKRLRALYPGRPAHDRTRRRETTEPDDTDAPSSRRQRRAV